MDLEQVRSESHTRDFQLQVRGEANQERRTVEVAFSSEEPYLRWFGYEVLDHSPESIRMARIKNRAPVLLHHDHREHIGVVESVTIDSDRRARAVVRFGNGEHASEVFNDVVDGIRSQVSVGYRVHEMILEKSGDDDEPVYRVTDWEPFEISIVSVAADPSVGVGRGEGTDMNNENLTRSERKKQSGALEKERERVSEILGIGKEFKYLDLAEKSVASGDSVEDFRAKMLKQLEVDNSVRNDLPYLDAMNQAGMGGDNSPYGRSMEQYSIVKLLRGLADPKELSHAGLELEISQDMQRTLGRSTSGVLVPWEALQTRATTIGGSGGNLKATELLAGNFIDVLRARSRVMSLGPTMLTGLLGDVAIPRKTASTSAYWIAGDGGDAVTESDPTFDQVTLSPKTVGGATTFSHKMIIQSTPDIETLVRQDLADMIAGEIDLKAIQGDGTGNTPIGVVNQTGINAQSFVAANPTWAEVTGMEALIAADNADVSSMAFLVTPAMVDHFKVTEKFSSTGITIWSDGREHGQGVVNGYRCLSSGNVPSGSVILADWSQLLIGMWGGIELAADGGGTNFLKGSVTVRVLADMDIAVRHPVSFCVGSN